MLRNVRLSLLVMACQKERKAPLKLFEFVDQRPGHTTVGRAVSEARQDSRVGHGGSSFRLQAEDQNAEIDRCRCDEETIEGSSVGFEPRGGGEAVPDLAPGVCSPGRLQEQGMDMDKASGECCELDRV